MDNLWAKQANIVLVSLEAERLPCAVYVIKRADERGRMALPRKYLASGAKVVSVQVPTYVKYVQVQVLVMP